MLIWYDQSTVCFATTCISHYNILAIVLYKQRIEMYYLDGMVWICAVIVFTQSLLHRYGTHSIMSCLF